jgi:hypothetical protein
MHAEPYACCIRQHTPAYASIREHTRWRSVRKACCSPSSALCSVAASCSTCGSCSPAICSHRAYVGIRQHMSSYAFVSIRQHTCHFADTECQLLARLAEGRNFSAVDSFEPARQARAKALPASAGVE